MPLDIADPLSVSAKEGISLQERMAEAYKKQKDVHVGDLANAIASKDAEAAHTTWCRMGEDALRAIFGKEGRKTYPKQGATMLTKDTEYYPTV